MFRPDWLRYIELLLQLCTVEMKDVGLAFLCHSPVCCECIDDRPPIRVGHFYFTRSTHRYSGRGYDNTTNIHGCALECVLICARDMNLTGDFIWFTSHAWSAGWVGTSRCLSKAR